MSPKERILETAFLLFHRQGYNSTGINQIISESKVAKASFYQHFKSKNELCVAFLNKRHDYWFDQLKKSVLKCKTNTSTILSAFDFLVHMNETENFRGCSFLNILSEIQPDDVEILGAIQSHKEGLRCYFKNFLNDTLSDHVYLLFESAIIESQLFRNQWPVIKAKSIVKSLIS
jgi:AcrR family transcriptional regulator